MSDEIQTASDRQQDVIADLLGRYYSADNEHCGELIEELADATIDLVDAWNLFGSPAVLQ